MKLCPLGLQKKESKILYVLFSSQNHPEWFVLTEAAAAAHHLSTKGKKTLTGTKSRQACFYPGMKSQILLNRTVSEIQETTNRIPF